MNRAREINELKEYFQYLKLYNNQLEDIDMMIRYCEQMIVNKRNSIPLKFVNDRITDAEYYYSIASNVHKPVLKFNQWLKNKK